MDEIRKVVNEDIQNYDYSLDFLDVTQTGRKTWIEVYVKSKNDIVKIKVLRGYRNISQRT